MKNLLKKHEQRQLNLVEELYHEELPITVSAMAERLGFSTPSIITDIEIIQKEYPFLNMTLDNQQIALAIEPNYNLNYFYKMFFKKSTVVSLLFYLFFHDEVDLEQLAEHLERSPATIYRLIQQTNEVIKPLHHIEIGSNPFEILGEENDIRRFFYQLFADITPIFDWPFEHLNEHAVEELITISLNSLGYSLNYMTQSYMKFIVAVNIIRLKQGNLVKISSQERSSFIFNRIFEAEKFTEKIKWSSHILQLKVTKKNFEQIFYIFINSDYILPFGAEVENSDPTPQLSQRVLSLNRLRLVISSLTKEFELNIKETEQLVIELHNAISLKRHDLDAENIIHNYKSDYIRQLEEQFPEFTHRALALFSEYCKDMAIEWTDFFKTHLIYQLFIHWRTLYTQLVNKDKKMQALIICKYNQNHAYFLKEYFEVHLGKMIKFNPYEKSSISQSDLENAEENIIISTFHLPKIKDKHVINVNFYPTRHDLRIINRIMLDIIDSQKTNKL